MLQLALIVSVSTLTVVSLKECGSEI